MATAVIMDDQNENLTLSLTDDMGNPVGSLPQGVVVSWAVKSNGTDTGGAPLATAPVALAPSNDTMSCNMKPFGTLANGVVVSATATLPPSTTPEEADLTVNVVGSPATGFSIEPGTPVHNMAMKSAKDNKDKDKDSKDGKDSFSKKASKDDK